MSPAAATPVTATTAREDDELVLWVTGPFDTATGSDVVAALDAGLPGSGAARVVVDLGGVTFCDSSGLGALIRIRTVCHEAGVPLALRAPGRQVRKLLLLTGLSTSFEVVRVSAR